MSKETLKILILCSYYNRPILVKNTLQSILRANEHHTNWHLGFVDDGSEQPGRPIVEDILKDHLEKITFVHSGMKFEDKIKQGLILGKIANQGIRDSDADVAFILCDDDELVPTYLKQLSDFFIKRQEVMYCFSKLYLYNPLIQKSSEVELNSNNKWSNFKEPINPVNHVDASQVAWRLDCCKKHGAWFKESTISVPGKPWTKDTDKSFFENLYDKCGLCHPTGFVGQFKGIHDYQLVWHKNATSSSLLNYETKCRELSGTEF